MTVTQIAGARVEPGLSSAEAAALLARVGRNELPQGTRERLPARAFRALREPMSLLLLVAAAVSGFGLRDTLEALAIVAIVAVNLIVGLAQEGRAARALEALRAMEAPRATVVRDARPQTIGAAELVPGDLVMLTAGDRVPADIHLTEEFSLEVDESLLTGESLPVPKRAHPSPGDDEGTVFAGTFVTRGSGRGTCVRTGGSTTLGGIAAHLQHRRAQTPLQMELRRLAARLGIGAVLIACGVFVLTAVRLGLGATGIQEAFLGAVALAVAAVPEGVPTIITIALALGVRRMADRNAIVRRLAAVETLGAATIILTDKTGTLTQNRMRADVVLDGGGASAGPTTTERIARAAVLCNDAVAATRFGDPLELALLDRFSADGLEGSSRVAEIPFGSERMRMTTLHHDGDSWLMIVKGAPEVVLARSSTALAADGEEPLDREARARIMEIVAGHARTGARMLAFAERSLARAPGDLASAERDLTFLGLVALRDPIRPEAAAAVEAARSAGVTVVMVTGDHAGTAEAIAREAGMTGGAPPMTGDQIRAHGLPDDPLAHRVYARVDPLQKLELVEALQERGHVLAVTGDGVNDAPALRRADIGVAMGRGSDVAREAADMVVTDDDLASIVGAIQEGRGIYDNIRKVVDYLVAGNISEIIVVVASFFLFPHLGVPLLPLQLLWLNVLTDGPPALALGVDAIDPDLMRDPPRARTMHMMTGAHARVLLARAVVIASAPLAGGALVGYAWDRPWPVARSEIFTILVVAHLLYAFVARIRPRHKTNVPPSKALVATVLMGIGLQVIVLLAAPLRDVFGMTALEPREWIAAGILGLLPPIAIRFAPIARR